MNTARNVAIIAIAGILIAGCAAPGNDAEMTTALSTPDLAVGSPVADFLLSIRREHPAAADYNDRQLIFMGDQFCVVAANMLIDEWAATGHDRRLLEAIAAHVTEHPEYCEGTEPVWPTESVTMVG